MQVEEPKGRARKFTDAELRRCLEDGLKPHEIATRFGCSRQAVSLRIKQLESSTVAAAVAPQESRRYVGQTIVAMEELTRGLARVNLLMDACDLWLRDPDDPERYSIGPRADEVTVIYTETVPGEGDRPRTRTKSAKLGYLLRQVEAGMEIQVERGETKHADPRELILKTVQESRQIVSTCADLAKLLADARMMERFREAVLAEIAKESPEVAGRVAEAVRRGLVVCSAFRGPEALPGG